MEFANLSLIYVIGAPGSGKGSLCAKLATDYGLHHLSVGDLLRDLAKSGSLHEEAMSNIQRNVLIHTNDLSRILASAKEDLRRAGKEKLLVDGVPRNLDQAGPVEEAIGPPDLVLFFDCPGEIAKQRFLTRRIPGRNDDGPTFDARYRHYVSQNAMIVDHYDSRGLLLKVDTGGDIDSSYAKLLQGLSLKEQL
ncbi:P-loop containing nucleoside triphosphate hydrolase protein [Aspergillus alliaceus]|uniref:P-loop containing nucleoside triphosphate hydrolase protein n=1 Tax=Petromyces alliaceus TaxID=209559 RepID=UPI0012A55542|nr:P-loop containing nucleoside triphosphate hydrolase protein [Aspergillus alliaceus]KAB8231210.1 P-loop containing nucleoside triphosphate hydrolase protein [Aspergillus alliaceus]